MTEDGQHKFDELVEVPFIKRYLNAFAQSVSLTREFERVFGKDKIHDVISRYFENQAVEHTKSRNKEDGVVIESLADFQEFYDNMWEEPHVKKTHTVEKVSHSEDKIEYRVKECIYAKAMRELDAADLGLVMMCNHDFPAARAHNPKLKLTRTKTLMEGHDCCDFVYTWDK